jgi:hypothetical protein
MAAKPPKGRINGGLPPKPVAPPKPVVVPTGLNSPRRGRPADNWEARNSRASDQNRVIAVRTKEGRYSHSSCADNAKLYAPSKTSDDDLVFAHLANRIAASGGMLCILCDTFIVPPSNRRDILRAEMAWEKANKAYKEGKLSKEDLAAAKRRFMSAATKSSPKR